MRPTQNREWELQLSLLFGSWIRRSFCNTWSSAKVLGSESQATAMLLKMIRRCPQSAKQPKLEA